MVYEKKILRTSYSECNGDETRDKKQIRYLFLFGIKRAYMNVTRQHFVLRLFLFYFKNCINLMLRLIKALKVRKILI